MDLVATHQRALVTSALRTQGPILELGVGWYSTPILHEIATVLERPLITVDNNEHWLSQFRNLDNKYHHFHLLGWWGNMPNFYQHYGLVFVDQGQPIEREYSIRRLINVADVFVLHDTEEGFAYGYDRTLPMFKFKQTDKCQKVWTTIASNKVDVSSWLPVLPEVEPSQEVT